MAQKAEQNPLHDAETWFALGQYESARSELAALPEAEQKLPPALHLLWKILVRERNYPEALNLVEELLTRDPYNVQSYIAAGYTLNRMQRYDEAVACLEAAVFSFPRCAHLRLQLATAHLRLKNTEDFERELAEWKLLRGSREVALQFNLN